MNFLQHLTTHILGSISYYLLKSHPLLISDSSCENSATDIGNQGFTILLPDDDINYILKTTVDENSKEVIVYNNGPVILYHYHIDEVIKQYPDNLFSLRRFPDVGNTMIYLLQNLEPKQMMHYFIEIQLIRQVGYVLIRFNECIYEWYPDTNKLYGNDDLISIHFKNKPSYISSKNE